MKIQQECSFCNGTGIGVTGGESGNCAYCSGSGSSFNANFVLPDDVYLSYQIFDATVPAEYAALSAANKSLYQLILSQVYVNLSVGSNARTTLANLFGEGTTTRTNLLALTGG